MNVRITIPTNWNELSFDQNDNIAHQLHCYHEIIKDDVAQMQRTSQRLFYQVTKELLRHNSFFAVRRVMREVHPKEFVKFSNFVYGEVDRTKFRTRLKLKGTVYHGPVTRLRNITIGEFSFADAAYYQWTHTKKPIWLDVLCATLYREEAKEPTDIDMRKPFVKQAVDGRADSFGPVSLKTKLGIAKSYEGCRNHIGKSFPRIFPKPIVVEGQPSQKPKKYVSFGKIILDKIDGDPSKLESSNNIPLYDFLSIIDADMERIRKRKK